MRGVAGRNARAQMAQCPASLAQMAQAQPMLAPLPGWPAMPYQQAVQPSKKSTRSGVNSDTSADKTALQAAQVHRTMEDLQLEGGETVADPSVTPGGAGEG